MLVKIKALSGHEFEINIEANEKILDLKQKIEEHEYIPTSQQRLLFGGRQLENNKEVGECRLQGGAVIHLVLALRGGYSKM